MTVYKKTNAAGLDLEINYLIDRINNHINTNHSWDVDIYHKIYKEEKNGNFYPYAFLSGKEYKEVFVNDKVNGEVGFLVGERRDVNISSITVPVTIIFSVNLDELDNGSLQREDEKVIATAQNAVFDYRHELVEVKTGLKNVYSGFDTSKIRYGDMQPFLNFSFTINVIYKNICDYGLL